VLPPDSEFHEVAAVIAQLVSAYEARERIAPYIIGLTLYNAQGPRIIYREPKNDQDIIEAMYRWDTYPYQDIF
jgi:hypothetical protein